MSMKTILIPPYTPQTPPRHLQGTRKANRQQQRPTDIARHTQMAPVSVLGCLRLSVYVCWHLLSSFGILCLLEMSGGCLGDVWGVSGGIRMVFMDIGGAWMCLWGIWVLSPCSMELQQYFGKTLKDTIFLCLAVLRHQNIKMSIYKVDKNDWVL